MLELTNPNQFMDSKITICLCISNVDIKNIYMIVCRCIAVRTTLSDENLEPAGPTLIRDNIGSVSLDDILSGGSVGYSM